MTDVDLAILGGTLVTPAGQQRVHLGVREGRIAYVGGEAPSAREVIDASGLMVLPGGVDTHVHLMDPGATDREDFPTGTRAAARAGVTTIVEHAHGRPVRTVADLHEKRAYLRDRSNVDYGLAAHAWPGMHAEVPSLWQAGVSFFKVFTCTTHGVLGHDPAALRHHFQATSLVGARSLVHCEDESLTADAERILREAGREDGAILSEWRSRDAELVAVVVATLLVRRTGALATIAHVSHPESAAYAARERAAGARLASECCPQYFLLREQEALDLLALRKFTPPARARTDEDEAAMWRLLREGVLTHISSDHAPSTLAQKHEGSLWDVHFGLPGIDTTMSALIDAAARGVVSWEDISRVYAEVPARLYGLWPTKGSLQVGFDADIALVDPTARCRISNEEVISKAGWSPYSGREMRGRVVRTILRGQTIASGGKAGDERRGRWMPGAGFRGA